MIRRRNSIYGRKKQTFLKINAIQNGKPDTKRSVRNILKSIALPHTKKHAKTSLWRTASLSVRTHKKENALTWWKNFAVWKRRWRTSLLTIWLQLNAVTKQKVSFSKEIFQWARWDYIIFYNIHDFSYFSNYQIYCFQDVFAIQRLDLIPQQRIS